MDIAKWLDEIVLPEEPPHLSNQLGLAPFLRPHEAVEDRRSRARRRKKRSTSDSSLLDSRPKRKEASRVECGPSALDDADASACSDASRHSPPSSGSSYSSQRYARRPRHKTRPERYDPKAKKDGRRGTQSDRRGKGKSEKKRRKSMRKKVDGQGLDLVQSSHANNVAPDRLTLKPRGRLGIFSKGKASTPVKGRGLPDLVFSEMKFLQKQKEQPPAAQQEEWPKKKKRKKDRAQNREDEISAYFASVRPALAEQDVNAQPKVQQHPPSCAPGLGHDHPRSSVVDDPIHTVELPERSAYLGFGGRGPRHESGSYVSWSESIRAPSASPTRRRLISPIDVGQLNAKDELRNAGKGHRVTQLQSPRRHTSLVRAITAGSGNRYRVSPFSVAKQGFSRSQSYPGRTSSPEPVRLIDQRGGCGANGSITSPSPMPASVPARAGEDGVRNRRAHVESYSAIASTSQSPDKAQVTHGQAEFHSNELSDGLTNEGGPKISSTLGRLIRGCNSAFNSQRLHEAAARYNDQQLQRRRSMPKEEGEYIEPASHMPLRRVASVHFADPQTHLPHMSVLYGPGIYEQQARRRELVEDERRTTVQAQTSLEVEHSEPDIRIGYFDQSREDFRVEPPSSGSRMDMGISDNDFAFPLPLPAQQQQQPKGRQRNSSNSVVGGGFWRPHKLY